MTDRKRNLYRIVYTKISYMDDEERPYAEYDYVETWHMDKAVDIWKAKNPYKKLDRVELAVEDI